MEPEDLLESEDDAPIIRLINALLTEAVKDNASDVHIEPYENRLGVRFRVDGILKEILQTNRELFAYGTISTADFQTVAETVTVEIASLKVGRRRGHLHERHVRCADALR